jgi:hypothetical protein
MMIDGIDVAKDRSYQFTSMLRMNIGDIDDNHRLESIKSIGIVILYDTIDAGKHRSDRA